MLFGIDRVSKCLSLTPGYLTWHVDDLVSLWCSRVGVVPSAVPANFYPPSGGYLSCRVWILVGLGVTENSARSWASEWGKSQQWSVEFGRDSSGENPSDRVMMRMQTCNDATLIKCEMSIKRIVWDDKTVYDEF